MYRARLLVGIFRDGRCGGRGCRRQVRIAEDLPLLRSDKPLLFERGGGGTRSGITFFSSVSVFSPSRSSPRSSFCLLPRRAYSPSPFIARSASARSAARTENRFVLYVRRLVILPAAGLSRPLRKALQAPAERRAPNFAYKRIPRSRRILTHKGVNGCGGCGGTEASSSAAK